MPKITSSYTGGLSRDLAISKNDNKHIYNALDIDIITDLGESSAIIANHKGNELQFTVPNIKPLYSITLDLTAPGATDIDITTSLGVVTVTISISSITDSINVYDQLIADPAIAAAIANQEFGIYYNSQEVIIQGYDVNPAPTISAGSSLVVSTVVAAQNNLSIIGWCTLEEEIILFTTAKTNTTASLNTAGQVWVLQYDDASGTILGLTGTSLNPSVHLKYNNILGFSLQYEIYREAIGRKESSLRGNIYWTDDYNRPRVINIYNPQCPAIPVGLLDWKPSIDLSTPIIDAVINGGLLLVGSYQVAYQLYSKDGATSIYSPASTLVPITDISLDAPNFQYDGAAVGTNGGKSIRTTINHIDLRYDFIKIILIEYEVEDVPVINSVYDVPIDGDSMSFTISGGENKVAITVEEFVNPLIFFDKCKTFTQKKNRLYPANTSTQRFEVEWDSRAYRFSGVGANNFTASPDQTARLYSRDGSFQEFNATIPGDLIALAALPDSADAVNAYNDESGQIYGLLPTQTYDDWLNLYQYKYQYDGVTLGGEGPNVKYSFSAKQYRGDDIYLDSIPYDAGASIFGVKAYYMINTPMIEVLSNVSGVQNLGTPALDGFDHPINGWDSIKNPMYATLFGSFARGEVYRMGIAFYNDKGEESFVKWISDIRIPEPWEDTVADLSYYDNTLNMEVRAMAIDFEFANLPTSVTGFRIVRVERQEQDKTRFGTGVIFGLLNGRIDLSGSGVTQCKMLYSFSNTDIKTAGGGGTEIPTYFINNDFSESAPGVPEQAPSLHGPFPPAGIRITRQNNLGVIKFPNFDFGKYEVNSASHFKTIHSYSWPEFFYTGFNGPDGIEFLNAGVGYWADYIGGVGSDDRQSGAFVTKLRTIEDRGRNIFTFNDQIQVDIEGIVSSNFSPGKMGAEDYHHIGIYTLPDVLGAGVTWELSGFATKSLFSDFNGIPYFVDTPNSITGSYINNGESGLKDVYFRVISLCRYNFGQYGGPWRSSRYNNTYIACSDFIPRDIVDTFPQALKVFGGDTYVSFYSTTLSFFHWKETYGFDNASPSGLGANYDPVSEEMSAIALAFPAELDLNVEYRDGKYWSKNQVFTSNTAISISDPPVGSAGSDFAKFLADEYIYNDAYSQENNLKVYIPKPFNFDTDERQPNWVWVSEQKFDREIIDNWRRYLVNNYLPLEGNYGPINKITNLKEMLLTYQDRGIAQVSSQEITALPDSGTGAVFQVGTGNILARYDYLSKDFGSFHQHSVVTGPAAVYSFDIRNKKFFRVSEGLENISDVKGLAAFFRTLKGNILNTDTVLLGRGIHGAYDSKYNKVYMTFENTIYVTEVGVPPVVIGNTATYAPGTWTILNTNSPTSGAVNLNDYFDSLPANTQAYIGNTLYNITLNIVNGALIVTLPGLVNMPVGWTGRFNTLISFTIAYNEMLQAFESFYSFKPTLYLPTGKRLFSANPFDINNSVYLHNEGDFGKFYDKAPSTSEVEFIVNFPDATKVPTLRIDTLEFWSEVFDANGIDVPLETITGILLYNDYQTTGTSLTLLTPQVNVVRRERTWRINQLRDQTPVVGLKPFLRDKYVKIKIFYNNQNNRYFRLNEFNTNVTLSYY